jgi:hypothetical protein
MEKLSKRNKRRIQVVKVKVSNSQKKRIEVTSKDESKPYFGATYANIVCQRDKTYSIVGG